MPPEDSVGCLASNLLMKKTKNSNTYFRNSNFRVAFVTAILLLIPAISMQFSSEWNWEATDFIVMGTFIFCTGHLIELVVNKVKVTNHRLVIVAAILLAFLYVWAELAVGIFTNLGN